SSRAHTTSFIEGDGAEGVVLPYTGAFGRQFGFVALRPTDGRTVTDFTADFKADTLEHYMDLAKDTELILRMPKFTREYNLDMKKPLSAMGLGIAFEPSRADFSNLSETPLFIGEALQKTKIEITENGTKAAAASMLTMIESSAAIKEKSEPRELILDSPYAYFLVDLELQSPLFMGVMESV
ncbi:MAG: serpin family protein, partial [Eubacterium sp.]